MPARFEWQTGLIRFYLSDSDADSMAPYVGVVAVNRTGPSHGFLFGLHATMTREMRRDLVACLVDQGITHTTDIRRGRWHQRDLLEEMKRHDTGAFE